MSKYIFPIFFVIAILLPGVVQAEDAFYNKILVKVNDDIITQYDIDQEMKPILDKVKGRTLSAVEQEQLTKMRKQILDKMVNDKLLEQESAKYGVVISDENIDSEIRRVQEERGLTEEEFEAMVKQDGITIEEFRVKLKSVLQKQEILSYMVHSKVLVTDSEIQKEYESRSEDYTLEKMVELAIILLPADIASIEVKKRIDDGEMTFAEAAEKYSVGPGKDQGGSIGDVNWSDLADDWRESITDVPEGGVGSPIVVEGKEALLSPRKIVEDRLIPLEEVRDGIFNELMQKKREKVFEGYFDKLKQSSVITYMD